jgi:arabinosaccharide transport system substrate-binding protein
MEFPYGKAPLAILLLALFAALGIALSNGASGERPTIVFFTFANEHIEVYQPIIAEFAKEHHVRVQLEVVGQAALKTRLQSAMQAGAEVPDMVEILDGTLGTFTGGPLEDVQFVDLTQRIDSEGLRNKLVTSRFGKWTSRGHIFALPHDVHPVMLCYRTDLCQQCGIDVSKLTTWDAFAEAGRRVVTENTRPDGVTTRYMVDFESDGADHLRLLYLQAGGAFFTPDGHDVAFDNPTAVRVIDWYVRQNDNPLAAATDPAERTRIAFPCGWGQNLAQAMTDGLCLFYVCPDWRTKSFQQDVPNLAGKLDVMPLPAWDPGGRRTSTWGGTGLAFTRAGKNFDLCWQLAMKLYYSEEKLGKRYEGNNILPPLRAAWTQPEFNEPRPFYKNRRLGRAYADLADDVPPEQSNAFSDLARDKFSEAFINASLHYQAHGSNGLDDVIRSELARCAADVRAHMDHNRFLAAGVSR